MNLPDGYPEIFVEMHEILSAAFKKYGISDNPEHALNLTDEVRRHFGGMMVYFPKGTATDLNKKHMEIYSRYNFKNVNELAREYDLSVQCIYRIVKYIGKIETSKRNTDIFEI